MTAQNWYMVNKMGMATLCTDKEGAEQEAADAQMAWPQQEPGKAVHQFRKQHCAEWYDGHADHGDGRGPYEERTLYTIPPQEAQEPVAWYVTGCGRLLDEDEAKAEARHIGGTARAMPLYTAPQADSVTAPAGAGVAHALSDAQIEAMPVWRNFVGLWPESRREIVDAVVDLLTTPPTQATDSVLEDAARSAVRVERRVMAPCTK